MSLHQANKDKPRAQKCRHFCFSFDLHNYCPTCREAGKGDDPCVTFETPCQICTSFSDEQLQKIQNRKRYLKKQKAETSSKDELDLLGEGDGDSFTGSNADLESAADNLRRDWQTNVLELKAVSLALRDFKDQCQNQTVLVVTDNSTVVAYINKQGGTHSAEMCALLWKVMTWCHHYHITLKARHIPGCLNVMADLLSRSNQVLSTEWSLHPQVFKQICQKWFTPHVDLFATHLNHKLPLYVSPIPDPRAWDIDALDINWTNLMAYAYPPTALLHKVIQKIRQCHCLIIVIAPGWPGMPWFWDLVQLSTEIPLQLPVSTTLFKQSHKYVFHNNPQHLNLHAWCLGADNSKNKASLWRWQREFFFFFYFFFRAGIIYTKSTMMLCQDKHYIHSIQMLK